MAWFAFVSFAFFARHSFLAFRWNHYLSRGRLDPARQSCYALCEQHGTPRKESRNIRFAPAPVATILNS